MNKRKADLVVRMRGWRNGLGLPVGHFLDDEAERTEAFFLLKVLVLGFGEGGGREEEGIVGGAGGGRAF